MLWCRSDEASLVRYLNPQEVQQHMQVRPHQHPQQEYLMPDQRLMWACPGADAAMAVCVLLRTSCSRYICLLIGLVHVVHPC
jgi:hypothetical protein